MKHTTRNLLMAVHNAPSTRRNDYTRYDDRIRYDGYDIENRFRDRTGREHYDNGRYAPSNYYEPIYTRQYPITTMHKIGFDTDNDDEEMIHGNIYDMNDYHRALDENNARKWMNGLENTDGTKGAHWTLEQAKQVMAQHGLQYDPIVFWVVLNVMYSDYFTLAKKYNLANRIEFYVDMACEWLDDPDAVENKAAVYYDSIVRH